MISNERIIQAIFNAVDELNEHLPEEKRLEKSIDTVIMDRSERLDSLGIINLIVATEQKICEEFEVTVNLTDEKAFKATDGPFRTIATLRDYIYALLEQNYYG